MALDPETLDRLRRGVPLRMSATGELRFDEGPITHPRVRQALREGLDLSDGGEFIVRLGAQWCYLTIEDCPLRATAVRAEGSTLHMRLDDGREVPLALDTLWDEPGQGLRAQAPSRHSGRPLPVRFTNRAQMDLADRLEEGEGEQTVLVLDGVRRPIARTAPDATPPADEPER